MDAISNRNFKQISWSTLVMFVLGFWLSSSLLIDAIIIPSLSAAGMMVEPGFPSASYLIFGVYNRLELICAALVLTSFLVFSRHHNFSEHQEKKAVILAGLMLVIATVYTYILTPQMSSLGLELNLFANSAEMPGAMVSMHWIYWILEATKLAVGATLLRWSYRNSCSLT